MFYLVKMLSGKENFSSKSLLVLSAAFLFYILNLIPMKYTTRIILFLLFASFLFQACNRAMSPYEAANNPRGKHCRDIK